MASLVTDNGNGTLKTGTLKEGAYKGNFDFFETNRYPGSGGSTLEQGAYNGTFAFFETNRHLAPAVAPSNKVPVTAPLLFLKLTGNRHRLWRLRTECL